MEGFKINPIAILGLTRSHHVIHSLKILEKHNLIGAVIPIMGLSLFLSLLPPYVTATIFLLSAGYIAFAINKKFKLNKENQTNVKSNLYSR